MSSRPGISELARRGGQTFCEQAGITLRAEPAPLYQAVVLATLLAKPIGARHCGRSEPRTASRRDAHAECDAVSDLAAAGGRARAGALSPL